jgi:hypothetical protein
MLFRCVKRNKTSFNGITFRCTFFLRTNHHHVTRVFNGITFRCTSKTYNGMLFRCLNCFIDNGITFRCTIFNGITFRCTFIPSQSRYKTKPNPQPSPPT